jgi:hypothetical protein
MTINWNVFIEIKGQKAPCLTAMEEPQIRPATFKAENEQDAIDQAFSIYGYVYKDKSAYSAMAYSATAV